MKLQKLTTVLLCLSLLLLTGCSRERTIRFGAADIGGMYYSFANAFTSVAKKDYDTLNFSVKNTSGSAANLRLLSGEYIELGIAQADLVQDAYKGTGAFTHKRYTGYKAVAALYTEACQIVVRKKSNIYSLDDLQGKCVSIGAKESGTEQNARQILKMSGLTDELVDTVNLDYTDAASQLASKKIDAFFCTAGIQTTVIEELTKDCNIRLLNIDEKCRQKLKAAYSCYDDYCIPENTYSGQDQEIQTIGVKSVLLASDKLSTETVKNLTSSLFRHAKDLQYVTSLDLELDKHSATKGISIPFHPGAVAYYAERGLSVH